MLTNRMIALLALIGLLVAAAAWLWTPDLKRADLEARYARGPGDFIEIAGLRLHLRDTGPRDAPVVILLHGFGGSLQTWDDWTRLFEPSLRVISLDLPGAGLTGADPSGDYTDARGMVVLLALMDKLGIDRASLVGHSMGGRLAWQFAAAHPDRVDKLVLVSPDGFASPGFNYGKAPELGVSLKAMKYMLPKALLKMSLAPAYANPAVITPELVTRYYEMMLAPEVRSAMIARLEQSVMQDPVPILARITAPTLLMWGDRDAMIPIANADDYLKAIPGARLAKFAGVGHLPQEEAAQPSGKAILSFLRSD
ncbi:MAG: alpha/beta fold hydrolase [Burkholderiales bacterium]